MEESPISEYLKVYQELDIIGKTNSSIVIRVMNLVENKIYVAKIMRLGFSPKEEETARKEVRCGNRYYFLDKIIKESESPKYCTI